MRSKTTMTFRTCTATSMSLPRFRPNSTRTTDSKAREVIVRVLGIDPGLTRCGVGVVDVAPNRTATLVHVEVLRTPATQSLELRLNYLGDGIERLLEEYT